MSQYDGFLFKYNEATILSYKERLFRKVTTEEDRVQALKKLVGVNEYMKRGVPIHELNVLMDKDSILEKTVRSFDLVHGTMGDKNLELYDHILSGYIKNIDGAVLEKGLSLLFFGYNGTGKTISALHCLCRAIELGISGYYISFTELMQLHNQANFNSDPLAKKMYKYILDCDFLVIDEVGKESKSSENVVSVFEQIVKGRVSKIKPTILITNITVDKEDGFRKQYGNSVYSSLYISYKAFIFSKDGKFRERTAVDWEFV